MNKFSIEIYPELPNLGKSGLIPSETLTLSDFQGKNVLRTSLFRFDDNVYEYGVREIYQIYIDICEEFDKIESGLDHDLEMSYYPVARVMQSGPFIFVNDIANKEVSASGPFSKDHVLSALLDSKRHIEAFVLNHRKN